MVPASRFPLPASRFPLPALAVVAALAPALAGLARSVADDPVPSAPPPAASVATAIHSWGWTFVPIVQEGRVLGFQGWPQFEDWTSGANFTSVWLARSQTNAWTVYGMRGGNANGLSQAILNTFGDDALDAAVLSPPPSDAALALGDGVELIHGLAADDPFVSELPPDALTADLVGVLAALGYEAAPGLSTILAEPCDEETECLSSVASPFEAMALGVEGALVGAPLTASTLTQLACCAWPAGCAPCVASPPTTTVGGWRWVSITPQFARIRCNYERTTTTTVVWSGEYWWTWPICASCAGAVPTTTVETGYADVEAAPCPAGPTP